MHLAPPVLPPLASSYSAFIIGSIILAYSQYHPVASFNWHNHPPPRNIRAATGPVSMSRALDVETSSSIDDDGGRRGGEEEGPPPTTRGGSVGDDVRASCGGGKRE